MTGWSSSSERLDLVDNGWIHEVLTTPDTPLRTHRITLTYSIFAECLNELLFSAPTAVSNANWFHFATWGTYTLGPNIRNDSAPQRLESLPSAVRRWVTPAIIHNRSADGNLVGRALSWGAAADLPQFGRGLGPVPGTRDARPGPAARHARRREQQLLDAVNKRGDLDRHGPPRAHRQSLQQLRRGSKAGGRASEARQGSLRGSARSCRLALLGTILLTIVEQDLVTSALRTVTLTPCPPTYRPRSTAGCSPTLRSGGVFRGRSWRWTCSTRSRRAGPG